MFLHQKYILSNNLDIPSIPYQQGFNVFFGDNENSDKYKLVYFIVEEKRIKNSPPFMNIVCHRFDFKSFSYDVRNINSEWCYFEYTLCRFIGSMIANEKLRLIYGKELMYHIIHCSYFSLLPIYIFHGNEWLYNFLSKYMYFVNMDKKLKRSSEEVFVMNYLDFLFSTLERADVPHRIISFYADLYSVVTGSFTMYSDYYLNVACKLSRFLFPEQE